MTFVIKGKLHRPHLLGRTARNPGEAGPVPRGARGTARGGPAPGGSGLTGYLGARVPTRRGTWVPRDGFWGVCVQGQPRAGIPVCIRGGILG